jgi:hypothetical protein
MFERNRRGVFVALGIVGLLIILGVVYVINTKNFLKFSHNSASMAAPSVGSSYESFGPAGTSNSGTSINNSNDKALPQATVTINNGQPYLIKTLNVSMSVPDPRKTATDLQNWIASTDNKSTSAGLSTDYIGNDQYNVSMRFQVQATLYPKIQQYLADYAPQHNGKLQNLNENVQDVSNDYVDTQSTITTLQTELDRLRELLGRAQSLADIITLEQKISDVEGQLDKTKAHMQYLAGQTTFYLISINLQPISSTSDKPQNNSWDPLKTIGDAFGGALGFGQWLVTLLIWLIAYGIFIVPLALIGWFIWRIVRKRQGKEEISEA